MCRRTTCKSCGKPTWAGCGAHVDQVLGDVPKDQRCKCREAAKAPGAFTTTPKPKTSAEPTTTLGKFASWLRK